MAAALEACSLDRAERLTFDEATDEADEEVSSSLVELLLSRLLVVCWPPFTPRPVSLLLALLLDVQLVRDVLRPLAAAAAVVAPTATCEDDDDGVLGPRVGFTRK